MKKQILFVDDEPKVLQGLQRMLRGMRHEWDMVFVESGSLALDHLAASSIDVVISDMRMPGMDGSELLLEIATRHPSTTRIILSGQCERDAVLKCVGPTHQFLTKPCDPELLISTIDGACRLEADLQNKQIKQTASSVQSLPSWPRNYARLRAEIESRTPSIRQVGQIISRDPAMAAKIVQLVSSGFFGSPQRVDSLRNAVSLLGLDTLVALVRKTNVFHPFDENQRGRLSLDHLASHCLSTAEAARRIAAAETEDRVLISDAHIAGLLHDIGHILLAENSRRSGLEEKAVSLGHTASASPEGMVSLRTLDDPGAYLMGLWGLPAPIVRAIAAHRSPDRVPGARHFEPLAAVHVAHAAMQHSFDMEHGTMSPHRAPFSLDLPYLERIGCAHRLDTWLEICETRIPERVTQCRNVSSVSTTTRIYSRPISEQCENG